MWMWPLPPGKNLLRIINDILDLSKIEAGKIEIGEENFCLVECMNLLVSLLNVQAHRKSLKLHCRVEDTAPAFLRGDAGRLRQILFNLVGNAVKFTDSGEVRLEVKALPREGDDGDTHLIFTVSDTGIGIPADKLPYIFEPFTQVESGGSKRFEGTGLGLAIARRLLDQIGGSVEVESEMGKGTTFRLCVSMKTAQPEEEAPDRGGEWRNASRDPPAAYSIGGGLCGPP